MSIEETQPIDTEELEEESFGVTYNITVKTPSGEALKLQVRFYIPWVAPHLTQIGATENVQELRQYLVEAKETCFLNAYHLECEGEVVNDYAEIGAIPGIVDEVVITMVEGKGQLMYRADK